MTSPSSRRLVIDMYSSRSPSWCMPERDVNRIRAQLPETWELVRVTEETDGSGDGAPRVTPRLLEAIREAEVYSGFGIPRELFLAAPKLRWVHSGAAGVGGSLFPEMVEGDVIFTNSAGIYAVTVAEHAVAMMFYFARALDQVEVGRRDRCWARTRVSGFDSPIQELAGATVAIIGYGGIGREIAQRAKGVGMQVWAIKRNPESGASEDVDRLFGAEQLSEVLAGADYVVISIPHTPETEGLIGTRELAEMKRHAVLINVARGRIVDEDALTEALRERRIRGAGLDVFREEPLPASSGLWELDNVCITPHIAGISPRFWERETDLIIDNVHRYLAGEPLLNLVDKTKGY